MHHNVLQREMYDALADRVTAAATSALKTLLRGK